MRPRRKHLIKMIAEQKKIIQHLENSLIEARSEILKLRYGNRCPKPDIVWEQEE